MPGGVAVSNDLERRGTFVNYGVQGGTPTYRNTMNLINEFGFETHPVHMMISFGKGNTCSLFLYPEYSFKCIYRNNLKYWDR